MNPLKQSSTDEQLRNDGWSEHHKSVALGEVAQLEKKLRDLKEDVEALIAPNEQLGGS